MGKYKIEIKKSAAKEIHKLPQKNLKRVLTKIQSLSGNPRPMDSKKLSAQEKYRVRVGQYRILYSIHDDVLIIVVVKVGHRKDIYEK